MRNYFTVYDRTDGGNDAYIGIARAGTIMIEVKTVSSKIH